VKPRALALLCRLRRAAEEKVEVEARALLAELRAAESPPRAARGEPEGGEEVLACQLGAAAAIRSRAATERRRLRQGAAAAVARLAASRTHRQAAEALLAGRLRAERLDRERRGAAEEDEGALVRWWASGASGPSGRGPG
jgi:hypothetical protein